MPIKAFQRKKVRQAFGRAVPKILPTARVRLRRSRKSAPHQADRTIEMRTVFKAEVPQVQMGPIRANPAMEHIVTKTAATGADLILSKGPTGFPVMQVKLRAYRTARNRSVRTMPPANSRQRSLPGKKAF